MPLVKVEYPAGQLTTKQKGDLAEALTQVLLEIEGGGDTPYGRAGSLIRFNEIPRTEWYVGGVNSEKYVAGRAIFLVDIFVPEGLLDESRKSEALKATTDAIASVMGAHDEQTRYFWIQVFEWPDGALASGGLVANLFGIAKRAGHPPEHPVLEFPRAYFEAKTRMHEAFEYPAGTPGLAKNRY